MGLYSFGEKWIALTKSGDNALSEVADFGLKVCISYTSILVISSLTITKNIILSYLKVLKLSYTFFDSLSFVSVDPLFLLSVRISFIPAIEPNTPVAS